MALILKDKIAVPAIISLSILVPAVVLVLMYLPERYNIFGAQPGTFPLFHAIINATTAILLLTGYYFMRKREYTLHRNFMISAFGLSVVFLISYVISKISNDPVPYGGD